MYNSKSYNSFSFVGLLFPLLFLASSFGMPVSMSKQIVNYKGSGTIRNTSIFLSPGYRIEFPSFDPKHSYSASYQVANIPQTSIPMGAAVCLQFLPSEGYRVVKNRRGNVTAWFRFTILDSKGKLLHSAGLALSNSMWTGESFPLAEIYHYPKSFFVFECSSSYVLKVHYVPGSRPPLTHEMHFAIEKGGHL